MRRYRDFKEDLLQELKDPEHARLYLKIALEEFEKDQDEKLFLTALRDVAEAQGGLTKLSGKANLNRQNLYKALSPNGNPSLSTIDKVLHSLGFKLSIDRIEENHTSSMSY